MASLADSTAQRILGLIVEGEFAAGEALPGEVALASQMGVSRLTVREAVKSLRSQQVLRAVHGSGTFVNPTSKWLSIDAVVEMVGGKDLQTILRLLELRKLLETGASELFAPHADKQDFARMSALVEEMQDSHLRGDVDGFVEADISFHEIIHHGCKNPFIPVVFQPIARALRKHRYETSSVPIIREHAIAEHLNIVAALKSGSPSAARTAMDSHLSQTIDDALTHLNSPGKE